MKKQTNMQTWFQNLKIGRKLVLGFSLILFFMGLTGVIGFLSIKRIARNLDEIFQVRMPSVDLIIETDRDLYQLLVAERSMAFTDRLSERFIKLTAFYQENLQQSQERWEKYKALASTEEEFALIPQYEQARDAWKIAAQRVIEGFMAETVDNRQATIAFAFGEAEQKFERMREYLNQLTDIHLRLAADAHQQSKRIYMRTLVVFLLIAGIGLLIGVGAMVAISASITLPLQKAVAVAQAFAKGDLAQDIVISTTEETGQLLKAMKEMIEALKAIVTNVKTASYYVASGSQELSSTATEMSEGANFQASSTEQLSSSMEEMAANISQNADHAIQTEKIAINAAEEAKKARKAMKKTSQAMQKIEEEISIIEQLSQQTRMLSLNAAIEAGKAQDFGKGFSVVASEVRELSRQTQAAAQKITELVVSGVKNVTKTSEILANLIPDIQRTAELVQEISAASREQNTGAAQVNLATQQLDRSTQQHSAISEQLAATAEELNAQARQLQDAIAFFHDASLEETPEEQPSLPAQETPLPAHLRSINVSKKRLQHEEFPVKPENLPGNRDQFDDEFERF